MGAAAPVLAGLALTVADEGPGVANLSLRKDSDLFPLSAVAAAVRRRPTSPQRRPRTSTSSPCSARPTRVRFASERGVNGKVDEISTRMAANIREFPQMRG